MKTFICIAFSLTLVYSSNSQKPFAALKEISIADLEMNSCAFEPDAPAMKLLDLTETEFDIYNYSTRLKTERKVRIKIFNQNGYPHATINIPYLSKRGIGKIKELNGCVYRLKDGKIVTEKLEKKDFYKEKAAENIGLVSFTFPNLSPGVIIEYSFTTIENNIYTMDPWYIQDKIPVLYSYNFITTPVQSSVFESVFGMDSVPQKWELLKYDKYRRTTYFLEHIPSFKTEPYMSSVNDHLKKVNFLLYPMGGIFFSTSSGAQLAWKTAGASLLSSKYYLDQVDPVIPGTEKIIDSAKHLGLKDRIVYVFNEVKKHFPTQPEQTLKFEDVKEAWKEKTGSSAEINLILINLFRKTEIKNIPMLISTRKNGKINKEFPGGGQLNGIDVLAFDSSKFYILDASFKHQSVENPPLNILNRDAFLLSEDSMQWVRIVDERPLFKQSVFASAELKSEGKMTGTATIQYYDYAKSIRMDTSSAFSETDGLDKKPDGLKILSSTKTHGELEDDPLSEIVEFEYTLNNSGDFYFINPLLFSEKEKNPFLAETRRTDLDLGCNQFILTNMHLDYPPSFTIEHLPKSVTVRAPDSSFYYKIIYTNQANRISVMEHFETKKAIFSADEYAGIRDFFSKMYAVMNEEIILKKTKQP